MKERRKVSLVREQLDHSLAKLGPLAQSTRPVKGWLRAMRIGLDISGVELAEALGVKPPRVVEMEKSERDGAITLKVLERAAEAMGCSLVYALIPRAGTLEQALRERSDNGRDPVPAGMALNLADPEAWTAPLTDAESRELRLSHIATRGELERWEAQGIEEAEAWAFSHAHARKDPPTEQSILALHGKMFGKVWKDSGRFRAGESGRGAAPQEIPEKVRELCGNFRHWAKAKVHAPDEACARLHHRLQAIRPFERGNGRLARLLADVLAVRTFGRPSFTWGAAAGTGAGLRKRYLEALAAADGRDYKPLLALMRA